MKELFTVIIVGISMMIIVVVEMLIAERSLNRLQKAVDNKLANCPFKKKEDLSNSIEVGGLRWALENLTNPSRRHLTWYDAIKLQNKILRLPTDREVSRFRKLTTFSFDYETSCGIFTDKKNGNQLKLPAAGFYSHEASLSSIDVGNYAMGKLGRFWTQSERTGMEDCGYRLEFHQDLPQASTTYHNKKDMCSALLIYR